jgi:hypothetical protein
MVRQLTGCRTARSYPVAQERATPAALEQHLQAGIVKWKPIVQAAGEYAD